MSSVCIIFESGVSPLGGTHIAAGIVMWKSALLERRTVGAFNGDTWFKQFALPAKEPSSCILCVDENINQKKINQHIQERRFIILFYSKSVVSDVGLSVTPTYLLSAVLDTLGAKELRLKRREDSWGKASPLQPLMGSKSARHPQR
jgi:hypothetical protein